MYTRLLLLYYSSQQYSIEINVCAIVHDRTQYTTYYKRPRTEPPNGGEGWMVSVFAWRRSPARGGGGKVYPGTAPRRSS